MGRESICFFGNHSSNKLSLIDIVELENSRDSLYDTNE